ncbi:hypothetical protein EAS1808013_p11170 (plasmid) [Enterobacter asburiae]|nr:hypothetical protein EAS1808013_p11170 [Enterobacter asburiae]
MICISKLHILHASIIGLRKLRLINYIYSDNTFLFKERLDEQDALILALQEKPSNRNVK